MSSFKERLLEEKVVLQERLTKLSLFLASEQILKLPHKDHEDLLEQQVHMDKYLKVLIRRIDRLL